MRRPRYFSPWWWVPVVLTLCAGIWVAIFLALAADAGLIGDHRPDTEWLGPEWPL